MLPTTPADPGFLALSVSDGTAPPRPIVSLVAPGAQLAERDRLQIAWWGVGDPTNGVPALLARQARWGDADLTPSANGDALRGDLSAALAPFAAVAVDAAGAVRVATDSLGFRHIYMTSGPGWAGVSTSPHALAACAAAGIDEQAVAVQSLLGWQLGQRTIYTGVSKLPAGSAVDMADGVASVRSYTSGAQPAPRTLDGAVTEATEMLRRYLGAYLDDHPDATLQLTGGQDSRLLLSAIPTSRRKGLSVMTLGVPGSQDVEIAADLAARYTMDHRVVSLEGLEDIEPAAAHELCVSAARRVGGMADPLAFTALAFAEGKIAQGPRLSGLGGEVARGFYYFGPTLPFPVTRRATAMLANWRMFANDAAAGELFEPEFRQWAHTFTVDEIHAVLRSSGANWWAATDELYLGQRMQRWAGVTETATCFDREVVNPMLDRRFIDIARALPPSAKRNSRFLSRLQVALDADLGALPLDGRPAPQAYATRNLANSARLSATVAAKLARKARQRVERDRRPPAGGTTLADKVVAHWRARPEALESLSDLPFVRDEFLADVLAGKVAPQPGSVALLVNLIVANHDRGC